MANKDRSLDLEAIAEKHQKALDFWPTQGMFIKTVLNSQLYELACSVIISHISLIHITLKAHYKII